MNAFLDQDGFVWQLRQLVSVVPAANLTRFPLHSLIIKRCARPFYSAPRSENGSFHAQLPKQVFKGRASEERI